MPLLTTGAGKYAAIGGGGGGAVTWNPADKSADLALSGGNLVATAGTNNQGARSTVAVGASQKVYMEYIPTVNANNQQFGFATTAATFGVFLGSSGEASFGIRYTGVFQSDGSADHDAAMPSWTTGDNVGIAYNNATKRFWSRVNGGAWSNSGDPAAGTGGRLANLSGTFYAVLYIQFGTEVTTAKFATASWAYSAPSGFTELA